MTDERQAGLRADRRLVAATSQLRTVATLAHRTDQSHGRSFEDCDRRRCVKAKEVLEYASRPLAAQVPAQEPCPTCQGHGWVEGIDADPLPSGEPGEPYQTQETCPDCGGAGSYPAQVPAQEERQVTALSGALSAVGDDLGEALRKSEVYRLGLADAAARANTAEAQRDQAWRNLDTAHEDIAALLRESGLGDYARPVSTHDVIRDELLPWVRRAARALGVESKEEGAG